MGRHKANRKKRKSCRRQVHGSDPESADCRQLRKDPVESEGWDSLDEGALQADYALNATESYATLSEEMEVTKRLSFLNFSVLPCAMEPELIGGMQTYDPNCAADDLLPGLIDSPRDADARLGRKRAARRKQTRRVKKVRCVSALRTKKGRSRARPGAAVQSTQSLHRDVDAESANSSVCEAGTATASGSIEMADEVGHTPSSQNHRGPCSESDASESSLDSAPSPHTPHTHNTNRSGREADDEESCAEWVKQTRVGGWWENDSLLNGGSTAEERKFQQILRGVYPILSGDGQHMMDTAHEFKHPGDFSQGLLRGRKKRCKPTECSTSISPHEVNKKIAAFVQNCSETELKFPLTSRPICRVISSLAGAYNLQYRTKQRRRLPVATPFLLKTPFTQMANRQDVETILKSHVAEGGTGSQESSVVVVGGQVPPIDDSNLGNRMLQGMGWRPGTGLGANEVGIQEPICAHMRPRYAGLGFC